MHFNVWVGVRGVLRSAAERNLEELSSTCGAGRSSFSLCEVDFQPAVHLLPEN